jgi:histidyl-tRNA synthetase
MKDFDSIDLAKIELVRERFFKMAKIFGFSMMDPSPIEYLKTLETKSGPAIRDEIYFFKDKGDRDVALRFDFTVGLTRFTTSQKSLRMPAKFGAFGGVFRYDEPQKGRYRYFHQWNVEIYGKTNIESESEIIEFASRLFDSFELQNVMIDINHRKLVESYINEIFDSTDQTLVSDILHAVDKITKKSKDEIIQEFSNKGYDRQKLEKIIAFSSIKGTPSQIEEQIDSLNPKYWKHLKDLFASLDNRNVKNIRINFGIVRGLDYYSGIVIEIFDTNSNLGALAGGGRYDSLVNAFGREDFGATGIAGGIERIILTMEEQNVIDINLHDKISILYVNDDMQKLAINIASSLRKKDIITEVDLVGRPLKKQMHTASDSKFVVIVAPKEVQENKVILKNMSNGKESIILINDLLDNPTFTLQKHE